MLTLLSSARGQVAGALFAILGLLTAGLAGAESYSPPSYSPPSYKLPKPPVYQPPVYQLPVYQPPIFHPPSYKPPRPPRFNPSKYTPPPYRPPSYFPPKKTPPKKVVHHHYKPVGQEKDVGTRVFYVPVPRYETKYVEKPVVVEKPVIVEKKVYVEKPVKVTKYWVKEVHHGRCVQDGPAVVHPKPSHSSKVLGAVPLHTKLHIKQCLTDKAGNWKWCSFDVSPKLEGWIPAQYIDLCPW